MDITRRQWWVAVLAAAGAHLLLLAAVWSGDNVARRPDDTPRGMMVSLERFDAAPPATANTASTPIETAAPQQAVPSAPTPGVATSPAPESANPAPESAAAIGPQPAPSETAATPDPAPAAAPPDAPRAAVAEAVTIRPQDTSTPVTPQDEVVARNAGLDTLAQSPRARGNGANGNSREATDDYIVRIRAWLSRHKQYPLNARQAELEGTVRIYLVIDQDGRILERRIQQSSGSASLDRAAEQMVTRSAPLPSMPGSMRRNRLEIVVPVTFALE